MGQTSANKRSRLLINRRFQYHFLGAIVLVELLIAALTGPITLAFYTYSYDPGALDDQSIRLLLIAICICFFVASLGLLFVGLTFSHRVSGPIYRVKEVCRSICHGHLPDSVCFRKRDFHPDLCVAVNEALGALRQSRESEIAAWREQARRLSELASVLDASTAKHLQGLVSDAETTAEDLAKSLGRTT